MNTVAETRLKRPGSLEKNPRLSQWLRVHRDGTVSIYSGKVEIGQGILTALAQIAAEELGIALERIRMVPADTAVSPDEGVTSGSLSIQDSGTALRRACAQARALLLERAAARLRVSTGDLRVEDGAVEAAGRRTSFWECADDALFDVEVDERAALKSPRDYRLVGKSAPRLDLPGKIAGQPRFIQDMTLPGMIYGRVVRPPYGFAALASLDDGKVKAMPGVVAVVCDGGFVGVIAEREEVAISAQRALRRAASWRDAGPLPQDIHAWLKEHAVEHHVISEKADAEAQSRATKTLEASYTKPFISHAPIGPSCAIAQFQDDKLLVWSHSQGIFNLRRDLAAALGVRENAIVVRHAEGSGCYGHNGADDVALDAALLARAAGGRPVQLQWMRDDEFMWEPYGSPMVMKLSGGIDAQGNIVTWSHELWSHPHSTRPGASAGVNLLAARHLAQALPPGLPADVPQPAGGAARNAIPLYDFPNVKVVKHYIVEAPLRTSALRTLGGYANVFALESFVDELAAAAGADPVDFRLRHVKDPRARGVIEAAAQRAGWQPSARGDGTRGRGFAFSKYKNLACYCAMAAEVEVDRKTGR